MKQFSYKVTDAMGIHARPAGLLVKEAASFQSDVKISLGAKEVDAKRIMGVMGLGAKQGADVTFKVSGADEVAAAAKLEAFMKANL